MSRKIHTGYKDCKIRGMEDCNQRTVPCCHITSAGAQNHRIAVAKVNRADENRLD